VTKNVLIFFQLGSPAQKRLELSEYPGKVHLHRVALRQHAPIGPFQDFESGGQEEVLY